MKVQINHNAEEVTTALGVKKGSMDGYLKLAIEVWNEKSKSKSEFCEWVQDNLKDEEILLLLTASFSRMGNYSNFLSTLK